MQSQLKEIVCEIRSLEPFPSIATRVLELASQPQVVPGELIGVIQMDPGLTSKVLRLCNSAYYGFQRQIASLDEAGNMLGVTTLVNLVLTSSAGRYFRDYGESTENSQSDLWMRSVTNALASRIIADHNRVVDPERAYTAGLLQNIGSLVLDRFFHNGRQRVFAVAQAGYSLIDAEKHALGLHHAEIGARLATRWGLPEVLTDTIRFHHMPEKATVDPLLTATVHLAETVATARIAGDNMPGFAYEVHDAALQLTGMSPGDFDAVDMGLQGELERAEALFEL